MQITREEAKMIHIMMSEFYIHTELSDDELKLFVKITDTFDFGRPVPHHGSGGGQILQPVDLAEK